MKDLWTNLFNKYKRFLVLTDECTRVYKKAIKDSCD